MTGKKKPTNVSHMFVFLNDDYEKQRSRNSSGNPDFYNPGNEMAVGRGASPKVKVSPYVSMGLCGDLSGGPVYFQPIRYLNASCEEPTALLSAVNGILRSISSN